MVLTASMLRRVTNVWWKSARESYNKAPNETEWETFKNQFCKKFIPDDVHRKKEEEFLALKHNQMSVAVHVHAFLQLSKFAKDMVDTKEKKVKRFVGGLHPLYEEDAMA